jgi:bifunctional non-homologous end joining protein LigD
MLAVAGTLPTGNGWVYEVKLDGVRCIAYVSAAGGLKLLSRNDRDVTSSYPELSVLPSTVPGRTVVFDGYRGIGPAGGTEFRTTAASDARPLAT